MVWSIFKRIEKTIRIVPPITMDEREWDPFTLALLAVLIPTTMMNMAGTRMMKRPIRPVSS